jgi:hypothetical protein
MRLLSGATYCNLSWPQLLYVTIRHSEVSYRKLCAGVDKFVLARESRKCHSSAENLQRPKGHFEGKNNSKTLPHLSASVTSKFGHMHKCDQRGNFMQVCAVFFNRVYISKRGYVIYASLWIH